MPRGKKVCSNCSTEVGVRTRNCPNCGTGFIIQGVKQPDISADGVAAVTIPDDNPAESTDDTVVDDTVGEPAPF